MEQITPGDLRDMLEAFDEQRSIEREWIATLVLSIINLCTTNKIKKRLEPIDFLMHGDRQRALRREKEANEAARKREIEAGVVMQSVIKSDDWGEL